MEIFFFKKLMSIITSDTYTAQAIIPKEGFWPSLSKNAMLKTSVGIVQDSHRHSDMILFILGFENNNNNNKNEIKQGTFGSSVNYLKLVKI